MYHEEKQFVLRFALEAKFPDDYDGNDDAHGWLHDWEARIKPDIIKSVFALLREYPAWSSRVRNRGQSASDEIEISLERDFSERMQ